MSCMLRLRAPSQLPNPTACVRQTTWIWKCSLFHCPCCSCVESRFSWRGYRRTDPSTWLPSTATSCHLFRNEICNKLMPTWLARAHHINATRLSNLIFLFRKLCQPRWHDHMIFLNCLSQIIILLIQTFNNHPSTNPDIKRPITDSASAQLPIPSLPWSASFASPRVLRPLHHAKLLPDPVCMHTCTVREKARRTHCN